MPSNRFDTSQPQQYVSQYVPLPFEAIGALGAKTQKEADEGAKAVEDLGALGAAIKAAPMYAENKTKFVNEYNDKSKALVEKYASDFGNPEFKRAINNLTTEFKARPEINAFTNTLKSFEDWQSQKKDAKNAMNLDYTYDMDPNNASNFRQRDVIKEGVYSPKMTQYEDWNETGKKVMGKIAEDSTVKELGLNLGNTRINNGETEVWSRKTGKYEGVSSPKLKNLSNLMIGEYANTVAGKHHLQSLVGQDVDYSQISRMAQSGNEQAIKTKAAIDQEFENHLYRSNASQIGQTTETTYDDQFITNRAAQKANDAIEEGLNRVPLDVINYAQGKPADLNNANPYKSLFSFSDNGDVVLADHTNSKNTYVGKNNQVYDISNIPLMGMGENKGLTRRLSKTGMTIYKDGVAVDNAIKEVGLNTELIKQKQLAANDYLRATGQLEDYKKKYPNPSDMRDAALKDMAQGVKSGTYHNQAVPIFSEETNQILTKRLLPTFNEKGEVTGAGLVGNMSVVDDLGNPVAYSEADKVEMLNGAKVTGGSFIGGDVIKVTKKDGTTSNLKLNMPILKEKNKDVVQFIQTTNKHVMNPPSLKEQQDRTSNLISNYNKKIKEVQESNSDPRIKSLKMDDYNKVIKTIGELEGKGFVQSSKFNMSNGDTAYSFVNYSVPGHPTQCMVVHSNLDISFANVSTIGAEEFQNTYSSSIQNAAVKEETKNKFTTIVQ